MTFTDFCQHVRDAGMRYGGSVISWGRSEKRNKAVGGHVRSFHMLWLAADIVFDTVKGMTDARAHLQRMGLHTKENGKKTLHVQVVPPVGLA